MSQGRERDEASATVIPSASAHYSGASLSVRCGTAAARSSGRGWEHLGPCKQTRSASPPPHPTPSSWSPDQMTGAQLPTSPHCSPANGPSLVCPASLSSIFRFCILSRLGIPHSGQPQSSCSPFRPPLHQHPLRRLPNLSNPLK